MDLWDSKGLQRIIMDYDGNSEGKSDENDGIMIYIYIYISLVEVRRENH